MAWYDNWLKSRIKAEIEDLQQDAELSSATPALLKADGDDVPDKPEKEEKASEQIGRKAVIEDPYFEQMSQSTIYKNRMSRLSNKTLKDVSVRDWIVSAIIQSRLDTVLRFSRPSHERFKEGFRFVLKDYHKELTPEDKENIASLEDFIYNCGRTKNLAKSDRMLFGTFLKMTLRDALSFGHIAVEKVLTRRGGLHNFRPLPGESVYLINSKASQKMLRQELDNAKKTFQKGPNDPRKDQTVTEIDIEYYKYIQTSYDNRTLAAFGDEDMVWKLFNPQNFADSNGYCYSPLELAIINVTNHLNIENFNANFFSHGYAARGVLHLKGVVTQSQLHAFRRQFYNTISGAQHAWKTPIVAGLEDVQWVPLSGTAREMEYISFNDHILRAICAQFQIDPIEVGLDYLTSSMGRTTSPQANEHKIEFSRERGLQPILMFYEDFINGDVLPAVDPVFAEKYKFEFVGYTDETPQTQVAQLQAEMTVHSTMNDLLRAAQKEPVKTDAADLPLNAAFWSLIERNYTKGEIREKLFGDIGASQKRELQYFPGDPAFMGWQQLLLTIDRQKKQDEMMKEQMEQQKQAQEVEHKHAEGEHQREEEQHDLMMEREKDASAHAVVGESLKDTAKQYGAATTPLHIEGKSVANPINLEAIAKPEQAQGQIKTSAPAAIPSDPEDIK
jgi:hypothetical protein